MKAIAIFFKEISSIQEISFSTEPIDRIDCLFVSIMGVTVEWVNKKGRYKCDNKFISFFD